MIKCSHSLAKTPKQEIAAPHSRPWHQFELPEIRDIAWLLFSPRLVERYNGCHSLALVDQPRVALHWLQSVQDAPQCPDLPQRRAFTRLGLYFEALIHWCLSRRPAPAFINQQILRAHLQVKGRVQGQVNTLGEIDFIVQDRGGQTSHLEATVKFYLQQKTLGREDKLSHTHWIGPNANDRLDKKFSKLFDKQLPLSAQPSFTAQYPEIPPVSGRNHLFCGMLFHHWQDAAHTPDGANPDMLRGHWVTRSEFATLLARPQHHFVALEKLAWLGGNPGQTPGAEAQTDADLASATPFHSGQARCFVRCARQSGKELGRLMVVPDTWPTPSADPPRREQP